ncbi:MAG: alpha/beta hydrolase [Myxococcaceae bacterium]|jgi:pimeloyl-ACP methyl ester carboxylesterase|nr:alpha/beta hydrolase [Myxococcaceae bacterium]
MNQHLSSTVAVFTAALALGCAPGATELLHVESDGVRLPVRLSGRADATRVVVYQHGGPLGTSDFGAPPRGLLELEADFRVVTWAQRGTNHVTGASTRERLTIEQHVVDLERVVRAVRLRLPDASVWLYGHSWGVPLTLSLAARRPELVSGLVLSDGFISAAQNTRRSAAHLVERGTRRIADGKDVETWTRVVAVAREVQTRDATLDDILQLSDACAVLEEEEGQPGQNVKVPVEEPFSPLVVPSGGNVALSVRSIVPELLTTGFDLTTQVRGVAAPALLVYGKNDCRVPEATA